MIKSFFQGFNLARALILIFVVGSIYGGNLAWKRHERINELKVYLGVDRTAQVTGELSPIEKTVREIQENSVHYTELTRQLEGEGLTEQKDLDSYLRKIVNDKKVTLGRVDFSPSESGNKPGYTDKKLRVRPHNTNEEYELFQISNFLYTVEARSKRVRVTNLDIKVPGRSDPQDIPSNRWTFDCEITVREKN